jgi:hypothetical protein
MIPEWLSDDAMARPEALGREMALFLRRRDQAKRSDPKAKVEPHQRLLELIASLDNGARSVPGRADLP